MCFQWGVLFGSLLPYEKNALFNAFSASYKRQIHSFTSLSRSQLNDGFKLALLSYVGAVKILSFIFIFYTFF